MGFLLAKYLFVLAASCFGVAITMLICDKVWLDFTEGSFKNKTPNRWPLAGIAGLVAFSMILTYSVAATFLFSRLFLDVQDEAYELYATTHIAMFMFLLLVGMVMGRTTPRSK